MRTNIYILISEFDNQHYNNKNEIKINELKSSQLPKMKN